MRSSFTAMALAFGIVTMTALPAMALTLEPVGGEKVGTLTPDESAPAPAEHTGSIIFLAPDRKLELGPPLSQPDVFLEEAVPAPPPPPESLSLELRLDSEMGLFPTLPPASAATPRRTHNPAMFEIPVGKSPGLQGGASLGIGDRPGSPQAQPSGPVPMLRAQQSAPIPMFPQTAPTLKPAEPRVILLLP